MKSNSNLLKNILARCVITGAIIVVAMAGSTFANTYNLDMEGSEATVPKGNTVTRKLYNIPTFGGTLKMRFKWHPLPMTIGGPPKLQIRLKHGSAILTTKANCYSTHLPSHLSPKCDFNLNVSAAEAQKPGFWTIEVTNNSHAEAIGFNIAKGNDFTPLVPQFKSTYAANCPPVKNLDLEGETTTILKGGNTTRQIFGIGKSQGTFKLRAKWHAVNMIPNTFAPLKIEVLRPNGTVAAQGNYYSMHSNKTPKFDITLGVTAADAAMNGNWKLRITNNSAFEVIGFNIERGNEINPLIPQFKSTFTAKCP